MNVSLCFPSVSNSSISGISPTPQHPRSGSLTPSPHHASIPAASSPPTGSDPPAAHLHHRSSSLVHGNGSARNRARPQPLTPHGSCLHKCLGITGAHGNSTDVVTGETRSRLPSNQNTHLDSLFLLSVFLCFSIYLAKRQQADSCISSDTEVVLLQ